jgi:UPF0176 protein
MTPILNIAGYKFINLDPLSELKALLLDQARRVGIKGTILLAPEGINIFLAGDETALRGFVSWLRSDVRFEDIVFKESFSESIPFKRMWVKLKKEIIRMNHPQIKPVDERAQAISPETLHRWFRQGADDAGRPLLLLDTRNEFEIEQGRFKDALNLHLHKFSDFPEAVSKIKDEIRNHAVVSYCTGGIRCEKATLFMNEIGLEHHWQLDGGILKYFEDMGGDFYEGECTVFDDRHALNPHLQALDDGF